MSVISLGVLVKTREVREGTVCSWSGRLLRHIEMLVNNTSFVGSNFGLLRLVVYRIVIFIQVIQRIVGVGTWTCDFSGWRIPSVIGLSETEFALSLDLGLDQVLSSNFSMSVETGSG